MFLEGLTRVCAASLFPRTALKELRKKPPQPQSSASSPRECTPALVSTLVPMHSLWPQKPNPGLLVCPQIHGVAFPQCQLPSSPSAKWNVKPHLWLALSPVMQGKQKAKWLFIALAFPKAPNPPCLPVLPLLTQRRVHRSASLHTTHAQMLDGSCLQVCTRIKAWVRGHRVPT